MLLQVYVGGSKHCTFKHRIPLENICAIEIPGMPFAGVTIQFIGFVEVSKTFLFFFFFTFKTAIFTIFSILFFY